MESTKILKRKLGTVSLYIPVHNELHSKIPGVPLLHPDVAHRASREFNPIGTGVERVNQLISAIGISILHSSTHHIEKQTGLLAIRALDAQLPYLDQQVTLGGQ